MPTHRSEEPMNLIDLETARRLSQDRIDRLSSDARMMRARRRANRRRWFANRVSPTNPPAS